MEKFARVCSITGQGMNQGWIFGDGDMYVKHEQDALLLAKEHGYESISDAYDNDACYYTEWEDDSDYQYHLIDGKIVEIED